MNFEKVMLCRWVDLQYLSEKESIEKGYTIGLFDFALSNVGLIPVAFMVFIGKVEGSKEYEVRVYKSSKYERFIQKYDEYIPRIVETDDYTSFFFYCYYSILIHLLSTHSFFSYILYITTQNSHISFKIKSHNRDRHRQPNVKRGFLYEH